jgi:hypothetical protein
VIVELGGAKSANTHLHLMEALTELYQATQDAEVKKSLEESLQINSKVVLSERSVAMRVSPPNGLAASDGSFERGAFLWS